ncbi:MAG: PDZ domain-containing protein, partial [Thermomicrobiales bacterium]
VLGANAADYLSRHPEAASTAPSGTTGVYVGDVRPASVAAASNLRRGDIVVGFAGKRVKDMSELDRLVRVIEAGSSVTIRFLHDGTEESATLQF